MKRCTLHIGMHRTGSTSIQKSLAAARGQPGWMYCSIDGKSNQSGAFTCMFSTNPEKYHSFQRKGLHAAEVLAQRKEYRGRLAALLESAPAEHVVISGESIGALDYAGASDLAAFLSHRFDTLRAVAYVRPPRGFMESALNQRIKTGSMVDFDLSRTWLNYRKRFQKFDEIFGRDNVDLWKYSPRDFVDGCVVLDFCAHVGIPAPPAVNREANRRLSREALGILYTCYKWLTIQGAKPPGGRERKQLVQMARGIGSTRFRLSTDIIRAVLERESDDIAWMEGRLGEPLVDQSDESNAGETDTVSGENELMALRDEDLEDFLVTYERETGTSIRSRFPQARAFPRPRSSTQPPDEAVVSTAPAVIRRPEREMPSNIDPLLTRRMPLLHSRFPLLLMWSQRAGCTTVLKWFFWHVGLYDTALEYSPWIHRYEVKVFKKRQGYRRDVRKSLERRERPVIKVVRDPRMRAVSCFVSLGQKTKHDRHWVRRMWTLANRWKVKVGLRPDSRLRFEDFLNFISDRPFFAESGESLDGHLAAQYQTGEENFVDRYVRIEDFPKWTMQLEQEFSLLSSDPDMFLNSRHHRSTRATALWQNPAQDAIYPEILGTERPPSYQLLLETTPPQLIEAAYSEDFLAYGSLYSDDVEKEGT